MNRVAPEKAESALPETEDWRKLLRRGTSGAFTVQVIGAGLAFAVHIAIARLLGVAEYGTYTLALTWITVLATLVLFGQDTSVVRFIPSYVLQGKWSELRGLRRGISTLLFVASGAAVLLGALVVYLLRRGLGTSLELTLLAGCLLLPVLVQLLLNGALLRGFKRAASSYLFNSVLMRVLLLGFVLALGFAFRKWLSASTVMVAAAVAGLVALGCSEWVLHRIWPDKARESQPRYEVGAWFKLGRQLFFVAVIGIVLGRVDILILGGLAGTKAVGPYYATVQLAAFGLYGFDAVSAILAPMVAERYAAGDKSGLARLMRHSAKLTFVVTAGITLVTAIIGRWVLELFGHGFMVAYIPLLIILGGRFVNAMGGQTGLLMVMTRFERQVPLFYGGAALLNILLSVLLIPMWGMTGAAIAASSATIVWTVSALIFVRKRLGINPTVLHLPA